MALVTLDQRAQSHITTVVSCLQQQLDVTQHENQHLKQSMNDQYEQHKKDQNYLELRIKGILQENDSLYATQERLEMDLYAKKQELDTLRKETQTWKRLHKELNKSLETEREEFDNSRSSWLQRESQLMDTIRLLQQQRQQKDQHGLDHLSGKQQRNALLPAHSAPCIPYFGYSPGDPCQQTMEESDSTLGLYPEEQDTPPLSPTKASLGAENEGTIKAQVDIITTLKAELEHQAKMLQQQHNLENHQMSSQVKNLVAEVDNIKQLNQALMEENESYQMLLHEKTISGGFISDSIMQVEHDSQDDYFGYNKNQGYYYNSVKPKEQQGLNLADELALASAAHTNSSKCSVLSTEEELLGEIKALQDANRALQLYMNKILLRIVENKHLENILSIDQPNKGNNTTTFIKSSTPPPYLQTPQNLPETTLKTVDSCNSLNSAEEMATSSSSDASSTKSTDIGDDTGGDSWTAVFRRMSSGFTGWTRSNDADSKYSLNESSDIQVDHVVRTLYCLNK